MSIADPVPPRVAAKAEASGRAGLLWVSWFGLLILISYGPTLYALAKESLRNPDFSHVVFAPFLAGMIAMTKYEELAALPERGSLVGLGLILVSGLLLCVGPPSLATFVFLKRFAFLLAVTGTIVYLRGFPTLMRLAYPMAALVLMIPPPSFVYDRLTQPLQFLASAMSEAVIEALGFSVLREGNILYLPWQTLNVVEACSGLRSLYALLFLTMAYAYFVVVSPLARAALLAAAVPIAIAANCGRIVLTAIAGRFSPEFTQGAYHEMLAWSVFVFAFVLLFGGGLVVRLAARLFRRSGSPS